MCGLSVWVATRSDSHASRISLLAWPIAESTNDLYGLTVMCHALTRHIETRLYTVKKHISVMSQDHNLI